MQIERRTIHPPGSFARLLDCDIGKILLFEQMKKSLIHSLCGCKISAFTSVQMEFTTFLLLSFFQHFL